MATYHLYAQGRRRPPKYGTSAAADAHHLNIFQRGFQLGARKHQFSNILQAAQLKQRCASLMWSLPKCMILPPQPCTGTQQRERPSSEWPSYIVPGMSFASMRVSGRKLLICYELRVWNAQLCALVSPFKLWQCCSWCTTKTTTD